jgi:tetrapyrrole methylase family protein/MazG family protein
LDGSGAPEKFYALCEVIERLRSPDGCPWDRVQTLESVRTYVLEEAHEVVEAIDEGAMEKVKEELGDLLIQVIFLAQLCMDNGAFGIGEVCEGATKKLVSRHPHVFGARKAKDAQEVLRRWEEYKRQEGKGLLDGVPKSLPALLMALRVSEKASRVGFDWQDVEGVWAKLTEEIGELREAMDRKDSQMIEAEIGDVLFAVANIARKFGIDPETALRLMLLRFKKRFKHLEEEARRLGKDLSDMPLETLDSLWEEAKRSAL